MNKNFQVVVRKKQEQDTYSEDIIPMLDMNNEVVLDKELKSIVESISHIGHKEMRELEKIEEEKGKFRGPKEKKKEKDKGHKEKEEKEGKDKEHKEEKEGKEGKDKEHKEEKEGKEGKEKHKEHKEDKKDKERHKGHKEDKNNPFIEYNSEKQVSKKRISSINFNDENVIYGRGQVYRSQKINIDKPKKDVVIKIGNIDRDIYIESVEMLKDGANILAMVVENINYYTAKPIPPKPEKKEDPKPKKHATCESYENECICLDGVVRNTTVITPCLIYLDIIGATEDNSYEVESASVECINTKYVLDNGNIVDNNSLIIGNYIESLMEGYVITISIVVK